MSWQRLKDEVYADKYLLLFLLHNLSLILAAAWVCSALVIDNKIESGEQFGLAIRFYSMVVVLPFFYIMVGGLFWGTLKDASIHRRFRYGPIQLTDADIAVFVEWAIKHRLSARDFDIGFGGWDNITAQRSTWYSPVFFACAEDYMLAKLRF